MEEGTSIKIGKDNLNKNSDLTKEPLLLTIAADMRAFHTHIIESYLTRRARWPSLSADNFQEKSTSSGSNVHHCQLRSKQRMERLKTPRMVVLIGIPASGKTTFAEHMEKYGWIRVSQDVLGTRERCILQTQQLLMTGRDVVIDRCNFNRRQRKYWTDIADEEQIYVGCVVFATPYAVCLERVNKRKGHETLNMDDPQRNEMVLKEMANNMELPKPGEGFHFCRIIRNEADVERVLKEVAE